MSMSKRRVIWIAVNGMMAVMLYFGGFQDIGGAVNVVTFFVTLSFVFSMIGVMSEEVKSEARCKGRSVDLKYALTFGFMYLVALIWIGWSWLAVMCFLDICNQCYIFGDFKDANNVQNKDQDN